MPRKKKKFIDKKNAITYQLIHRSQKDPLQADEDASRMVLVTGDELAQAARKERLATMGIYYDDEYDYEQHMRTVEQMNQVEPSGDLELFRVGSTAASRVTLPAEVLPSETEEKIGMLELAAPVSGPKIDWDPDIVAALDSDYEESIDGELDDDFVTMANQSGDDMSQDDMSVGDRQSKWLEEQMLPSAERCEAASNTFREEGDGYISSDFDGEDLDEVGSMESFSEDEAKTRFTSYSMSSSVVNRNAALTLLDDKFEKLYAEYDEEEIGALDHEEIDGKVSTDGPLMDFLLKQFEKQQVKVTLPDSELTGDDIQVDMESDDESEEEMTEVVVVDEGNTSKWDCESILSTYSDIYNHPKLIEDPWKKKNSSKKIELTKKLGIPVESIQSRGLTKKQLRALDNLNEEVLVAPVRRRGEQSEERRQRKAAVKADRKERRVEKKNTKLAFRQEESSLKKQNLTMQHGKPIV